MTDVRGTAVSPRMTRVLAPNPGPMTLEGTNTYLLREPGREGVIVVVPGPDDAAHLDAITAAAAQEGGRVALVLLTHNHADHTAGVPGLVARTGAPVRGAGEGEALRDGERLDVDRLVVEVVATPGHTSDSVSLLLEADGVLLTGDTVLGRGTTVVTWPDGDVGRYLESLDRVAALTAAGRVRRIAPGHGPLVDDPAAVVEHYRKHRRERLAEVNAAVEAGATTPEEVVRVVYGELDPVLARAAGQSVRAQLAHLGLKAD